MRPAPCACPLRFWQQSRRP